MLFKDESASKDFLIRPVDLQPLTVPIEDVQVWEMVLPASSHDYVCLGHPVTDSIENKPDPSKYCCAKKDLIIEAKEQVFATSFTETRNQVQCCTSPGRVGPKKISGQNVPIRPGPKMAQMHVF